MISYGKITQDDKDRIDIWIKSIQSPASLIKLHSVLQALQIERELIDNDVFHIPLRRFQGMKAEDVEALFQSLMMKGIIVSGTNEEDILKNPKLASKEDSWVGIEPERFQYLLNKLQEAISEESPEYLITSKRPPQQIKSVHLIQDWYLVEEETSAELRKDGKVFITFNRLAARPYTYFKFLSLHYGNHVTYQELQTLEPSISEGNKKQFQVNKDIRSVIYSLNEKLIQNHTPLKVDTVNESFILRLKD